MEDGADEGAMEGGRVMAGAATAVDMAKEVQVGGGGRQVVIVGVEVGPRWAVAGTRSRRRRVEVDVCSDLQGSRMRSE